MKHGDGGKGDAQRPGKGFDEGFERIWGSRERAKYIPPALPDCAKVAGDRIGVVGARLAAQVGRTTKEADKGKSDE